MQHSINKYREWLQSELSFIESEKGMYPRSARIQGRKRAIENCSERFEQIFGPVQPQSEGGLQWVKAVERLPAEPGKYCIRWGGNYYTGDFSYPTLGMKVSELGSYPNLHVFEWLDESASPSTANTQIVELLRKAYEQGIVDQHTYLEELDWAEGFSIFLTSIPHLAANTEEGAEQKFHVRAETVEEEWNNFWKGIVCNPDGSVNVEQVKKELADFSFVMEQVPKVYCHITGSLLSKVMYHADVVIAKADEYYEQAYELDRESDKEDLKEQQKAFAEWLAENTEIIRTDKITLYRYCDKMNEWGNYTLEDIHTVYSEL